MEDFHSKNPDSKNIEIDIIGINHLQETRKWTMFLSIAGFCFIGISIVVFVFAMVSSSILSATSSHLAMIIPLSLLYLLYYFPIYYLFQFSKYTKRASSEMNSEFASKAFRYLKMHYRFMGIAVIIVLCLQLLLGLNFLFLGRIFELFLKP